MSFKIIRWNSDVKPDKRTEEKQLMDVDRKIGFRMSKFSVVKCDIVRIIEKLRI